MTTRLASRPRSTRRNDIIGVVVTGLVYAGAMAAAAPALRLPAYVDQVTIDNPHAWDVNTDVTDRGRDGWVGIGPVHRDTAHTFHHVIDQGDTWIFAFAYAGEHAELRVSRHQLEQDDWRVTVPDELIDRLRSANVPETPP
jgi:hypothetical protein